MDKKFKTKPLGHRITQYYTILLYCAAGFAFFSPEMILKSGNKIFYTLLIIAVAIVLTYVMRVFNKEGVTRAWVDKENLNLTYNSIPLKDIIRLQKIQRPGLFGPEFQIWTDTVKPKASIVLSELVDPNGLIDTIKEAVPGAAYKEVRASYHFLDWGLLVSIALIIWLIYVRVFA
ncbi:MAG TPA: hypothetical protein PLX04_07445 [Caldisericia bacterium]|nr:hypothetical protein [Caldisericia bacterium]OQB75099.1 MAG: hypothetical protein BWX90_00151 [bacterium ADurb.Bin132]HNY61763.1 hypothetical protein [Caldisericia bacterium]HOC79409.1 hypothetical protein [Caldisericia bacterium]HOG70782.1 hypothetical protein [Caldisericia bacterium]